LTGIGIYDRIGAFGGMGSALPITGFANSIVSPAMEYKREGFVLGVGAKMFIIAGPVIVYGLVTSFIVALFRLLVQGQLIGH
jgi:stage V sporulation protein AC